MPLSLADKLLMEIVDFFAAFEFKTIKKTLYPEFYRAEQSFYNRLSKKYKREKNKLQKDFYELRRRGYIVAKYFDGQKIFSLTPKGYSKILQVKLKLKKKKPKVDGKYRIVIFDISEKEKIKREFFRNTLKILGFQQLQKSVWYTKNDVFAELGDFIKDCHLRNNVKFITATKIQEKF